MQGPLPDPFRMFYALGSRLLLFGLGLGLAAPCPAQQRDAESVPVVVDDAGVMRWTDSGEEVALFGVNYSTPFAHAYRAHGYLGVDRKQAIDADVLHLARLGVDAYRIHVWDREVSDAEGNLVENDHLDLLDYLLARLADHGIRAILTPIAWWPAGYPEPDPGSSGFSEGYSKEEMSVDPKVRRAQARYLGQFVAHVNPYTGRAYRDDPNIVAIEIFNEPRHPAGPEETTRYIDRMAGALREAGLRKPIFYNISENFTPEHGRAVCEADIRGVSHQWYPTGLVRNGAIGANMLPNVDRYTIPYADYPACRDKARMVYEFDAADVAGSYMYPAMARSFRGAGFQFAAQFAYDPLALAYANTEYQTHFLNLVYTPRKAIGFLIAGAAFRALPRGASFGTYPESERFGPFRVSYTEDRSELVSDTAFYYSNGSETEPPAPAELRHVAGVGSSPVVRYEGSGAYFLDRLADGVWRLEVYPDVARVHDPFTRPSLDREAVRVVWRTRPMRIDLPDLGDDIAARPLAEMAAHRPTGRGRTLDVRPGVYLLSRSRTPVGDWSPGRIVNGRPLGAFVAPPPSEAPLAVVHTPSGEVTAGETLTLRAQVVSPDPVDSVAVSAWRVGAWRPLPRVPLEPRGALGYEASLPGDLLEEGLLEYVISVFQGDSARTFPGPEGGEPGHPYQWDFTGRERWRVRVVPRGAPVLLFDAARDLDHVLYPHPWSYVPFRTDVLAGSGPGRLALSAVVEDFAPDPHHFALRTFLTDAQRTRLGEIPAQGTTLRIRARAAPAGDRGTETGEVAGSAADRSAARLQVALVERDGAAWGTTLELSEGWREHEVPLADLRPVPLALLPRPYPQFLPYLMEVEPDGNGPQPSELDGLQFSTSASLYPDGDETGPRGFQVERVVLEAGL